MTPPLDAGAVARLRELEAQATAGPWKAGEPSFGCPEKHFSHSEACQSRTVQTGWYARGDEDYDAFWTHAIWRDVPYAYVKDQGAEPDGQIAGTWDYESGGIRKAADVEFIAAVRNALPALLVAAELRLRVEDAREALDTAESELRFSGLTDDADAIKAILAALDAYKE